MNTNLIKPKFLSKADQYLLTHYPIIWQTRIIWVAFYSGVFFVLAYFFGDHFDAECIDMTFPSDPGVVDECYEEGNDWLFFSRMPLFLSSLVLCFWLYAQYQQAIDYSKLSLLGFISIILLNFTCMVFIFLPVWGISLSTFDVETHLTWSQVYVQGFVTMGLAAVVLPFILRQFTLIEMVLVVLFGFGYCAAIALVLNLLDIKDTNDLYRVYFVNYLFFGLVFCLRFWQRTYTQQTKRLALLCLLTLPLVLPMLWAFTGVYDSLEEAFIALASVKSLLTARWLVVHILTVLVMYSLVARFIYRSLIFPIKRK